MFNKNVKPKGRSHDIVFIYKCMYLIVSVWIKEES